MTSTETYYGYVFWFMKIAADETAEGSSSDCCWVRPRHFQGTGAGDQPGNAFQCTRRRRPTVGGRACAHRGKKKVLCIAVGLALA
jgi:hypothetical protein